MKDNQERLKAKMDTIMKTNQEMEAH
jgi:hypothetical protein